MRTQIQIQEASGAEDRALVEQIQVAIAMELGLVDTTVTSQVPKTIRCYYGHIDGGFAIGERVVGQVIIIDFYSGREPSPHFPAVEARITSELRRSFGERIKVPDPAEYIQAQHILPESDAANEFRQKQFRHKAGKATRTFDL